MEAIAEGEIVRTVGKILCCQCGTPIEPNPANLCVACLRIQVDITEGIPKQVTIQFCRFCERYLQPPQQWVQAALESRELMALCLKKLKGLNKVKLIDANFLWTEPHSKRLKVKLQVQAEVLGGAILQQTFVVEFCVAYQMCPDCHRTEAKDHWNCLVQVRQKTKQRKTLFFLEQLLIKYNATKDCVGIKPHHEGLDFFFATESKGKTLVEFLQTMIPIKYQHSKKLISHDVNSNTYNYKYSFSVEVVPVCKDNVVALPRQLAHNTGGIGQICVVNKVTQILHLIDPNTCQIAEIGASTFFKLPFLPLNKFSDLVEYTVMNIEPVLAKDRNTFKGQGKVSHKHILADCWVTKTAELGVNDDPVHCRTFMGGILSIGDSVLGLDLRNSNVNNPELEKMSTERIPDVVLIKKVYAEKALRNRRRRWRLKRMEGLPHMDTESCNNEYVGFMEDIEEDPAMRQYINIYKDNTQMPVDEDDEVSPDLPQVTLAEMLDDLDIGEAGLGEEDEGEMNDDGL